MTYQIPFKHMGRADDMAREYERVETIFAEMDLLLVSAKCNPALAERVRRAFAPVLDAAMHKL